MDLMERFSNVGTVPVVTLEDAGQALSIAGALLAGGIDVAEIMFHTDVARDAIQIIAEQCPDMLVGAGTVYLVEQYRQATETGAQSIVSPDLDPYAVDRCLEHELTVLLGCVTPSEIVEAPSRGISTVKFLPASIYGGLEVMKALFGPFVGLQFVPIGGINVANLAEYARVPFVRAVGGGWSCSCPDTVQERFEHITELCRQVKNILAGLQGQKNEVVQMKYLTFGEIMLRLKSPGHECLFQNGALEATFGGREANAAVPLANFGVDAAFLTVLPDNPVDSVCMGELQRFGVDTSRILTRQGRIGIYFLESGVNQRSSKVAHDRIGSAIVQTAPSEIDRGQAFVGIGWFHITGITPALSESAMELSPCAVREAKARGVIVSCDLNYRKNLWKYGKEAPRAMWELTKLVDVAIANEEDVQKLLGISAAVDVTADQLDREKYRALGDQVFHEFPNPRLTTTTLRESVSADIDGWSACLSNGSKFYTSGRYEIRDIVDRVDDGDSFAIGLICGLTHHQNHQEALELMMAASCLKHSILGDFSRISVADVEKLMAGDGLGRVQH